jgi:uncharacterized protein YcfJ
MKTTFAKLSLLSLLATGLSAIALLAGCSGNTPTRNRDVAVGTVIGAGAGALVGADSGNSGTGAVVGGATGAVVGSLVTDEKNNAEVIEAQQEILTRQQAEIERQRRELKDLERQQYHNDKLRQYERRAVE